MGTEYACQWRTFKGGAYDRIITRHPLTNRLYTVYEAQAEVDSMNQVGTPWEPRDIARLVTREVTDWVAP